MDVAEARKTALWSLCTELSAVGQSWDGEAQRLLEVGTARLQKGHSLEGTRHMF